LSPFRRRGDARFCTKRCSLKAQNLRLLYGISAADYRALLASQDNACAICKTSFTEVKPHVDHDHSTGRIRGLLCSACNVALGFVHEDKDRVIALLAYIQRQPI
jgi:hypothetical protein